MTPFRLQVTVGIVGWRKLATCIVRRRPGQVPAEVTAGEEFTFDAHAGIADIHHNKGGSSGLVSTTVPLFKKSPTPISKKTTPAARPIRPMKSRRPCQTASAL